MPDSPPLPTTVLRLVERFTEHRDTYLSNGAYNETQLRREFLDPLFKTLGWDVDNEHGHAEAYKDVIHEDAIKVGGATKAPDYCFRIGGTRKFFLEAKKPSVDIKSDPAPAYQLRRYAWSAKLPLSILSDFEEIAVYDCRFKPNKNDKPSAGRVMYFTFDQLSERWAEFAGIFAREAILKGSFDKYAESAKRKRGTAEVDAAFLAEIEHWRDALARNLALRNKDLPQRDLNFAVQRTIDRIIFLRICEDRGVEPYGTLQGLLNGEQVYQRLFERFQRADERYNSGLFHFTKEKGRHEAPDDLTPSLLIDDKILKDILTSLYYPDSPYEFSVLPADILGQVYEQFLGKVIRLTKGHRAVVEEKPEVRKAGGVYYTPTYIVDYIVKHTVGKLVEGKTPQQVGGLTKTYRPSKTGRPITVLDPACGSGSFLLGAYQFLLNWYRDQYLEDGAEKHTGGKQPRLYQHHSGDYRPTTTERKRILTSHIFGVDIDAQAVETTKLSLLLKVLEGESAETIGANLQLFHERALPDLADNIKCGNSLIGPDFYDNQQANMFDEEERLRINVFDWHAEFSEIMQAGGFDAVIGNPPYIRIQTMRDSSPESVDYYKTFYLSAEKGNYDIYVLFVEQALSLLNMSGRHGFILPHKFFNSEYGRGLRALCSNGKHLSHIVHFTDEQVFAGATTYTCLLFLTHMPNKMVDYVRVEQLDMWRLDGKGLQENVTVERFTSDEWNITLGAIAAILTVLDQIPVRLGDVARLFVGLQTDADDVYILEELAKKDGRVLCRSRATSEEHWFEDDHLKLFLKGSLNICRYHYRDLTKRLLFPYKLQDGKSILIRDNEYKRQYPLTWEYLQQNKHRLSSRNRGHMGEQWYGYVYKKNHTRFGLPKLLVPSLATGSCFCADLDGQYYFVGSGGGGGGGYGVIVKEGINPLYILGLVNSKLLSEYLRCIASTFRGGYIALNRQYISRLPIRMIDLANTNKRSRHDHVVSLVQTMLDLHKQLEGVKTNYARTAIRRQIDATDKQIDRLVYELYGLSDEEIAIVEEAVG